MRNIGKRRKEGEEEEERGKAIAGSESNGGKRR